MSDRSPSLILHMLYSIFGEVHIIMAVIVNCIATIFCITPDKYAVSVIRSSFATISVTHKIMHRGPNVPFEKRILYRGVIP